MIQTRCKLMVCVIAPFLLGCDALLTNPDADPDSQPKDPAVLKLESDVETLEKQNAELVQSLEESEANLMKAEDRIEAAEAETFQKEMALRDTQTELEATQAKFESLQSTLVETRTNIGKQFDEIMQQLESVGAKKETAPSEVVTDK